jgi:hypothetical protein
LESDPALPGGHFVTSHFREESFDKDAVQVFAQQFGFDSPANQLASFAEQGDILLLGLGMFEQVLLCGPALVPQTLQLIRVDGLPLRFKLLLDQSSQGKVHVVTAEQNMVADCETL